MLNIKATQTMALAAQVAVDVLTYFTSHRRVDAINARFSIAWLHRLLNEVEREMDGQEQRLLASDPHMWTVMATGERSGEPEHLH